MSEVATAVAGTIADLFGEPVAAEPEAPNGPTDAAAQSATAPDAHDAAMAVELPNIPDLPEDLAEFLDEPDYEEERALATREFADDDEFVDPDELARQNAILKKRLEFAESKRAEAEKNKWKAEAEKYFPYADVSQIRATSRRGFLREARASHEVIAAKVQPILKDIEAAKEAARQQAYAEAKAEAAAQWGKPNVGGGPSGAPVEAVAAADDLDRARNSRNLAGVAKALIQGNRI